MGKNKFLFEDASNSKLRMIRESYEYDIDDYGNKLFEARIYGDGVNFLQHKRVLGGTKIRRYVTKSSDELSWLRHKNESSEHLIRKQNIHTQKCRSLYEITCLNQYGYYGESSSYSTGYPIGFDSYDDKDGLSFKHYIQYHLRRKRR